MREGKKINQDMDLVNVNQTLKSFVHWLCHNMEAKKVWNSMFVQDHKFASLLKVKTH
jgi:hypothetical protein